MLDLDFDFDTLPIHCAPQLHLGHGHQGPAVIACVVDGETGDLWVHNGQYATKVMFCPYCGKRSSDVVVQYANEAPDAIDAIDTPRPRPTRDLEPA